MFVGVCRLSFHLHGNGSLKGKRKVMRSIIDRTRAKFNVSVAEVADNDSHRRGVVGIAVIGNDAGHVDSSMANITRFIEHLGLAPVSSIETEVIPLGGDIGAMDEMSATWPKQSPEPPRPPVVEDEGSWEDESW
jgi:uncharacterized protein